MAGIVSLGVYVPRLRLERAAVYKAMGWYSPFTASLARGQKSVAYYDEDSITMAVAAGLECLIGADRKKVDRLYLASTTLPYQERQNGALLSQALDLKDDIAAFDITGTVSSGLSALVDALDVVSSADRDSYALVCSSDCRLGKPGSQQEHLFGDGGASFLVGNGDDVKAEVKGTYSITADFPDRRRAPADRFDKTWEERWIRDAGLSKLIPAVVNGLLDKAGIEPGQVDKLVMPVSSRLAGSLATRMGISSKSVQDDLVATIGDTGSAYSSMILCGALEKAKTGDKVVAVSFGSGAKAVLFEVKEPLASKGKGLSRSIAHGIALTDYQKYCTFREIGPREVGIRAEAQPATAFSVLWRERKTVFGFYGTKCRKCGTPQFPPQRICANPECGVVDEMEPYRFAEKIAEVFTYTGDMLAVSPEPPQIYGIVDFEGGGRAWLDFTDCRLEDLRVGMPVRMTFRRKYNDPHRSISGYFWKAVPIIENAYKEKEEEEQAHG
ncbi:MAG: hydroxymethylglutaryl-CoA synthase family protein [Deltaproteobacteria bacterium]|nr:hydroxymethylglutaryl-CoA synthase family protein [Deltaproteobacteria bacterium]